MMTCRDTRRQDVLCGGGALIALAIGVAGALCVAPYAAQAQMGSGPSHPALSRDAQLRVDDFSRIKVLARGQGPTRVIVKLDVPNIEALTAAVIATRQRGAADRAAGRLESAIATVAQTEVAKLAGTQHAVGRIFKVIPYMALSVAPDAINRLDASPGILRIVEDRLAKPTLDNTTNIVGASAAWSEGFDGTGWYVAVLDTGLRASHEFFAGKTIVEACFSATADCPNGSVQDFGPGAAQHHATPPSSDHGTHVSGIAVGNGPSNPRAGVAKGANLIAIQVFSQFFNSPSCGGGDCVLSFSSDQIAGLEYVFSLRTSLNIASSNMSLGGGFFSSQLGCDNANPAEKAIIQALRDAGIATVIAAGNDGFCDGLSSPGCISSAVAVGAVTDTDIEASFSNFHSTMLDIYAPGVNVRSSLGFSDSAYGDLSGTSMATPHVTGTWAILRQTDPNAGVGEILEALQQTGAPVNARCVASPDQRRIQIDAAVDRLRPACLVDQIVASDAAADAQFGTSVAINGNVILVGAPFSGTGVLSAAGSAYVYRFDGTSWNEEATLTAADAGSGDQFGNAVSVSGDVALVAAHRDDDGGNNAGAVYVFRRVGTTWSQEQKLTASDSAASDFFGSSVDVEGDVAVVGAFVDDCLDGSFNCGSAYVFRFDGANWIEEQKLTAFDEQPGAVLGISATIDNNVIVVGAQNVGCLDGSACGAVYVFQHDGTTWIDGAKLVAPDAAASDFFGTSVDLRGNVLVVGAKGDDCDGGELDCGSAYVFRFDGTSWANEDKLRSLDAAAGDSFGSAVAAADNAIVVGAQLNACNASTAGCGAAYAFHFDGVQWMPGSKLRDPNRAADDRLGLPVSADRGMAVVGAARVDCVAGANCGAALVFGVLGDCNLNATDDTCDLLAGTSVDLDGDGLPDECACNQADPAVADVLGVKNRFLSFQVGTPGALQAIRVTFVDLPAPFDVWNGATLWVGPPSEVSLAGSSVTPLPGFSNFQAATLQCTPFFMDWSGVGVVQVFHEGIIPLGAYRVEVLDDSCRAEVAADYSAPLDVINPKWGDTLENLSTSPPGPPDGDVSILDVLGILGRFVSDPSSIVKARSDLEPACLDLIINIADALRALTGFQGLPYPFAPSAPNPCDSTCGSPLP